MVEFRRISNIVIIGLSGTGKTTSAKFLSELLEMKHVDTDWMIEKITGTSVFDFISTYGEKLFREIEKKVVTSAAKQRKQIISCGGGVVEDVENIQALQNNGIIFCLWVDLDIAADRLKASYERPILKNNIKKKLLHLSRIREEAYKKADIHICTDHKSAREVAQEIFTIVTTEKSIKKELFGDEQDSG